MKIQNNINSIDNIKSQTSQCATSFRGKNYINKLTSIKNWEFISKAMAALGITSVVLSQTKQDENVIEFKKIIDKQTNINMQGEVVPAYSQEDTKMLLQLHKINPNLTTQLATMKVSVGDFIIPRFKAVEIRNLVILHKENPELLDKLINAGTIQDEKIVEYTYLFKDIVDIVQLYENNPNLVNKIVDSKIQCKNIEKPKYTKSAEYQIILDAYNKNSELTEYLLKYPELIAREVAEIVENISPDAFYQDLKKYLPENNIQNVKGHSEISNLLKKEVKDLQMDEKRKIYSFFSNCSLKEVKQIYYKHYSNLNIKLNQIKIALGMYQDNISVPMEKQKFFVKNILVNNNPDTDEILKNFDFSQYKKEGLPLKYSRKNFIFNIESVINNLSQDEQEVVLQHFGLIRGHNDFDGLLTNKPFEKSTSEKINRAVSQIQDEIELFTIKNEVITGDKKADKVLTGLIQGLPEFTFFIGKEQHDNHAYSLDIHTLKVLQSAMNHPKYTELSNKAKTVLKMSILLHDLGKKGLIRDEGHEVLSEAYTAAILKKFPFNDGLKKRIQDIILNHHWFEEYNMGITKPHKIAALCRYPQDIQIYEIFAKSDVENINNHFYIDISQNVSNEKDLEIYIENKMQPIYEAFYKMRSQSNFAFDTEILNNGEKFPKVTIELDGKAATLKVLDFNKLHAGENLQKYGFAPGITKENAYFTVHATPISKFENTLTLTQNNSNQVAWSTSLIKFDEANTAYDYGFIFNTDQANLSIGYFKNLSLGNERNIYNFINVLFLQEDNLSNPIKYEQYKEQRVFLRNALLENLSQKGIDLTEKEYVQLVECIISKKFLTQINKDIQIGNKTIKAKDLVEALEKTRESLFRQQINNELEFYNASVSALFAKADKIEDCPKDFLRFAVKHNLPIVLFPKNSKS